MKLIEPAIASVRAGGADIRYLFYDGDGPDMVFMHATGFIPWLWHPVAREFAGRYRIFAPYLYEHRTGDPEKGGVNWRLLAEDTAAFCDALGIGSPILVGHSMGGTLSVVSDSMRGSRAEKMVLFEPVFLPEKIYNSNPTIAQHPFASRALRRGNYWKNADEARRYFIERELFRRWDAEMLEIYIAHGLVKTADGGLSLACPPRQEAALFMGDTAYNPWGHIDQTHCDVLVVEGGQSEIATLLGCREAASRFQRGSHRLVKDAGHLIPMEKPRESIAVIRDFLG